MSSSYLDGITSFFASYGLIMVLVSLIPAVIMGIFTAKLAAKKGYRGYFFTGFFFNVVGLIYVVGMPLARDCSVPARMRFPVI